MKPSPVQLLQSRIDKIAVEVNSTFAEPLDSESIGEEMTLEFMEQVLPAHDFWKHTGRPVQTPGIEGRTYYVSLGVRNKVSDLQAPYQFEIVCSGVVACLLPKIHSLEPDEAAKQYGLAMIYGAMREHFLLITSRMLHGSRILPTVSFMEAPRSDGQVGQLSVSAGTQLSTTRFADGVDRTSH